MSVERLLPFSGSAGTVGTFGPGGRFTQRYSPQVSSYDMSLRDVLRGLPVFVDVSPSPLDAAGLPDRPLSALVAQLRAAIAAGETEPHAMTLSTVSGSGVPSSRVLLCKDVDDEALYFATSSLTRKGREIAVNPCVSVCFYWRSLGRQFRVVGKAVAQDDAISAADFAARSRGSRIAARVHQDDPPTSPEEVRALAALVDGANLDDASVPSDWTVYGLVPEEAELWQARQDRLHDRVQWTRSPEGWRRGLMWP